MKKEMMKRSVRCISAFLLAVLFTSCPGFYEDNSKDTVCISYEKRSSGCNNYSYGEWEYYSYTNDDPRQDWTLEDFEDNYSGSHLTCELNCCVTTQYRNADAFYGVCP